MKKIIGKALIHCVCLGRPEREFYTIKARPPNICEHIEVLTVGEQSVITIHGYDSIPVALVDPDLLIWVEQAKELLSAIQFSKDGKALDASFLIDELKNFDVWPPNCE